MIHKKNIALVGTCPSSKHLALALPDDWELWVCAPDNLGFPRVDVFFELHGDLDAPEERDTWSHFIAWINANRFPVFAQSQDLIPRADTFPAKELVDRFGPFFFTSQIAWMMAYAIHSGAETIGLFGLDMAAASEYGYQRPAMHHFVWTANQAGIKVFAPPESEALAPPPLYGYSTNSPMGRKLRVRRLELEGRLSRMEAERQTLEGSINHFRGALDDLDWMQQTWTGGLYEETHDLLRIKPEH